MFLVVRMNKCTTPDLSEPSSRPSFEDQNFSVSTDIKTSPKDHTSAKVAALFRDEYRCMITGAVDSTYLYSSPHVETMARDLANAPHTTTNLCHIFPPSANWELHPETSNNPRARFFIGLPLAFLCGSGQINACEELSGSNAYRLSNGLTMSSSLHSEFNKLRLWLEEIPPFSNRYRVCTIYPGIAALDSLPHPRTVTFTTQFGLDLPDPRYLKIHAAVCRVAHISGAAGYLDKQEQELGRRHVLAQDGSSAELPPNPKSSIGKF
ncbi:hypothetical protein CPB83DRAFT_762663 [Crepidotus variabilis]|uniref:HNH nuclease domain-containing protein n=1 Tax=Crepidotus variabilis TaxID=179855 RepID=A0A9P6JSM0_9AGAR|nr:hypothetical protein CPB83DRAFT_762663 [Crepidotus variabilis]